MLLNLLFFCVVFINHCLSFSLRPLYYPNNFVEILSSHCIHCHSCFFQCRLLHLIVILISIFSFKVSGLNLTWMFIEWSNFFQWPSWSYNGSWIYDYLHCMQSMPITTNVASSNPAHGDAYSIQHYVIKFVSDLQQVGDFLRKLRFPPPIKLTARI